MKRFEYKVANILDEEGIGTDSMAVDYLNKQGQDGWELCSQNKNIITFKRPIEDE